MKRNSILSKLGAMIPMLGFEEETPRPTSKKNKEIKPKPKRRQSRTLYTVKDTKPFWKAFNPKRLPNETYTEYKERMKKQTGVLKWLNKRSLRPGTDKKGNQAFTPIVTAGRGSIYHR